MTKMFHSRGVRVGHPPKIIDIIEEGQDSSNEFSGDETRHVLTVGGSPPAAQRQTYIHEKKTRCSGESAF